MSNLGSAETRRSEMSTAEAARHGRGAARRKGAPAAPCELKTLPTRSALVMRFRCTAADMPRGFYHRYAALLRHLSEHGSTPVSPPFAIYDNIDGNAADVEAGFVIEGDVPSLADMRVTELPGATVVALAHSGDYSNIEPSYFRLLEWMHELGLKRTGRYMEMYLNSPLDTPSAELSTELMAPVGPQSANDH